MFIIHVLIEDNIILYFYQEIQTFRLKDASLDFKHALLLVEVDTTTLIEIHKYRSKKLTYLRNYLGLVLFLTPL